MSTQHHTHTINIGASILVSIGTLVAVVVVVPLAAVAALVVLPVGYAMLGGLEAYDGIKEFIETKKLKSTKSKSNPKNYNIKLSFTNINEIYKNLNTSNPEDRHKYTGIITLINLLEEYDTELSDRQKKELLSIRNKSKIIFNTNSIPYPDDSKKWYLYDDSKK